MYEMSLIKADYDLNSMLLMVVTVNLIRKRREYVWHYLTERNKAWPDHASLIRFFWVHDLNCYNIKWDADRYLTNDQLSCNHLTSKTPNQHACAHDE